jgi:hypothetical protein
MKATRKATSILDAIGDTHLFASHFPNPDTWARWRVLLAALFGHPLSDDDLEIYRHHTGRAEPPASAFNEAWLVCGRRGGKSRMLALIEVGTASFRSARGYTFIAVLADELAFWRSDESTNPDIEILRALRPGLMTIPNAKLLCASSPYARKGALWEAFNRYFGKDDAPVLVWRGTSTEMNPTIPEHEIAAELEKDLAAASAEYLAEFRTDVESYISLDAVRACIATDVRDRLPMRHIRYHAFVDTSGGSSDSMTLSIMHREGNTVVHDLDRERPAPFSPEAVIEEYANELKRYRITTVVGDRYAGEWPRERFRIHGINYEVSDLNKSELYVAMLPIINSRGIDLLDNGKLVHQLVGLERKTARGGRDTIDHPKGAHDDVCNAVAGACWLATTRSTGWRRDRPTYGSQLQPKPDYSGLFNSPSSQQDKVNPGHGWLSGGIKPVSGW